MYHPIYKSNSVVILKFAIQKLNMFLSTVFPQ